MAKVNIKSEKITPFGGIYYASKAFYALSLDKVINGTLGVRSSTYNGYQWDEIMSAMSDVFLCGGDCVEDVNRSECHLRESPEIRIPTSHTIPLASSQWTASLRTSKTVTAIHPSSSIRLTRCQGLSSCFIHTACT